MLNYLTKKCCVYFAHANHFKHMGARGRALVERPMMNGSVCFCGEWLSARRRTWEWTRGASPRSPAVFDEEMLPFENIWVPPL